MECIRALGSWWHKKTKGKKAAWALSLMVGFIVLVIGLIAIQYQKLHEQPNGYHFSHANSQDEPEYKTAEDHAKTGLVDLLVEETHLNPQSFFSVQYYKRGGLAICHGDVLRHGDILVFHDVEIALADDRGYLFPRERYETCEVERTIGAETEAGQLKWVDVDCKPKEVAEKSTNEHQLLRFKTSGDYSLFKPLYDLDSRSDYWRMVYFSATAFTGLGFGDIVPTSRCSRTWVLIETLIGLVFLGVLAGLVLNMLQSESEKEIVQRPAPNDREVSQFLIKIEQVPDDSTKDQSRGSQRE